MNHKELISLGQALGYRNISSRGICRGFSMMWAQAVANNGLDAFDKRLKLLSEFTSNPDNLFYEVRRVRHLVKKNLKLSERDQCILEIPAFFDGISLYQYPILHNEVFTKSSPLSESELFSEISTLTKPQLAQSALVGIRTTNQYSKDKLKISLDSLATQLEGQSDIGVVFSSIHHSISGRYLGNNQFEIIDTNFDFIDTSRPLNIDELCSALFQLCFEDAVKDETLIMSMEVIANSPEQLPSLDFTDKGMIFSLIKDPEGDTLLHKAVSDDDEQLFDRIQLNEENINKTKKDHNFILCSTIIHNNIKMASALLEGGIDVNTKSSKGQTPLSLACKRNHIEIVQLLLNKGALIDVKAEYTALHTAAEYSTPDILQLLLKQDPKACNVVDNKGLLPLDIAINFKRPELVALLLPHTNLRIVVSDSPLLNIMHNCSPTTQKQFLIKSLETYITQRKNEQQPLFFDFFNSVGLGYSERAKIEAARAFLNHVKDPDHQILDASIMGVLQNGRLGVLFDFYSKHKSNVTGSTLSENPDINSIEDLTQGTVDTVASNQSLKNQLKEMKGKESDESNTPTNNGKKF